MELPDRLLRLLQVDMSMLLSAALCTRHPAASQTQRPQGPHVQPGVCLQPGAPAQHTGGFHWSVDGSLLTAVYLDPEVPPFSLRTSEVRARRGRGEGLGALSVPWGSVGRGALGSPTNGSTGSTPSLPMPRCPATARPTPSCPPPSLMAAKLGFLMKKEGPWKTESVQEAAGAAMVEWRRSAPRCGSSFL